MATAPDLKVVAPPKADDAIRERHGCRASYADSTHRTEVLLREEDNLVVLVVGPEKAKLTQWQARYLAAKLYRLARRIRQRDQ